MQRFDLTPKKARLSKIEYLYALLYFALPAALMLFLYIGMGHHPLGDASVLVLDLNAQYAYFLEGLKDILQGDGSLLYSFSRALGGEFGGMLAYYLASPLNLLLLLFKDSDFLYSLLLIIIVKTGLCGLSFGCYLRFKRKTRRITALSFACLYALSGYCVVMQHNLMWTDNVFLLPLICWGIEEMVESGKYLRYVLSLSLAIISNFYIGYMSCIFAVLYFFYAYFERNKESRLPFLRSSARFGFWSLVAGMISSIIVIPAYYSLSFGKNDFSVANFEFNSRFDLLDLAAKFLPGSYDTVRPEGLPFVYCGVITLILFAAFFYTKRIPARKKIAAALLSAVLIFSFSANTLDLIWHGFQLPNWLNYRYSYMLSFVMLVCAASAWDKIKTLSQRSLFAICASLFGAVILLQALDAADIDDRGSVWTSLLLVLIMSLTVLLIRRAKNLQLAKRLASVVICVELLASAALNMYGLGCDVIYSTWSSYTSFIDKYRDASDSISSADSDFYRTEKTVHRRSNDNFSLGLHGLSNSTSTLNSDTVYFLEQLGFASRTHWSKYLGATPVSDSLLGVRYVIKETDEHPCSLYEELDVFDQVKTVKNPYALSLAFGVGEGLKDFAISEEQESSEEAQSVAIYDTPLELQNDLMSAISGCGQLFYPISEPEQYKINVNTGSTSGHRSYRPKKTNAEAFVGWRFEAERDGCVYAYFPSKYLRDAEVKVNGKIVGKTLGNDNQMIVDLGYFSAGDEIDVSLKILKDNIYIKTDFDYFWQIDEDEFKNAFTKLSASNWSINEGWTDHRFTGSITLDDGVSTVMTTIPYDEGWHIMLDGKEIEYYEVLDALIAFDCESGSHTLDMYYLPDCYVTAAIISSCGFLILVLSVAACRFTKGRRSPKNGKQ